MQEKLDKISEKTSRGKSEIIREAISRLIVEYEAESGTRTPKEVKNG
jgi:predicted DNA-binding protein